MSDHHNLIGGVWTAGDPAENRNPSDTSDVIGTYHQATPDDVAHAIAVARSAFPAWRRSGAQTRMELLDRIGAEILARSDELADLLAREEGKTRREALGEVTRAGNIFRFFAGECVRTGGELLPSVRPEAEVLVTREPIGVVSVIAPWNFPIAIPAWKIAPALAYGNCVVFKPAELTPASAWALAEIIHRAGAPAGVFNLLMASASPARPESVIGSAATRPNMVSRSNSKWAARTRCLSSPTPILIPRFNAPSTAPSFPPGSVVPPRRA